MLMETLDRTQLHYIKCIKPNNAKAPALFEAPLVMEQLRYSGTLEVVRIRREGYPARIGFRAFYDRFAILAFITLGWLGVMWGSL
jgi:myosin heavy subunit